MSAEGCADDGSDDGSDDGFAGHPAGSRGLLRIEVALFAAALATFALLYSTPAPTTVRSLLRTTRAVLTDPALLALYAVAATLMGGFVAVHNAMTFRLVAPPYGLPLAVSGLVSTTYAVGSVASVTAAGRHPTRRWYVSGRMT